MKRIGVFSGSRLGTQPEYREKANQLGEAIANQGLELVYGGTKVGLMGITADSVLKNKGKVIGVISQGLSHIEVAHPDLTELYQVEDLYQRKAKMTELSDAFVALPGGYGTLDEIMDSVTWGYLGIHRKPIGLLNLNGFYDPLLEMIEKAANDGFIPLKYKNILVVDENPEKLMVKLLDYRYPTGESIWKFR